MKNFKDLYEGVASVVQRKKLARRMSKLAKSPVAQMKKQRAMLRVRNPTKLAVLARKKTIQKFRDKFYPSYKEMSLQQRVKVDQMVMQKYGVKIDKISKKVAKQLQKLEIERVKKAKEGQKNA
jgi:hypothetical protein|tara:strand:- start:357 stop:725 length:369 start_codon:yes stop_codon:yes gene_type:complete